MLSFFLSQLLSQLKAGAHLVWSFHGGCGPGWWCHGTLGNGGAAEHRPEQPAQRPLRRGLALLHSLLPEAGQTLAVCLPYVFLFHVRVPFSGWLPGEPERQPEFEGPPILTPQFANLWLFSLAVFFICPFLLDTFAPFCRSDLSGRV